MAKIKAMISDSFEERPASRLWTALCCSGTALFIACAILASSNVTLSRNSLSPLRTVYHPLHTVSEAGTDSQTNTAGTAQVSYVDAPLNATLGFEKIFVINLPTRTDQRDVLTLASRLTGLNVEFIDGVVGKDIDVKGMPTGAGPDGAAGCWRSHINIMQKMVAADISSALLLEDDADWDVHIKQQMQDFATGARALLQPPSTSRRGDYIKKPDAAARANKPLEMSFTSLPVTLPPTSSPYGDNWDLLWLGHCGVRRPGDGALQTQSRRVPRSTVLHYNDPTVPDISHIHTLTDSWYRADIEAQPPHTRLYHHPVDTTCTWSYAVSQRGARRILYEVGVQNDFIAIDGALRGFCNSEHGDEENVCLTVQPPLISMHFAKGNTTKDSNINEQGSEELRTHAFTDNIRWSTRLNIPQLLEGEEAADQWAGKEAEVEEDP